jgi:hypothetical protein
MLMRKSLSRWKTMLRRRISGISEIYMALCPCDIIESFSAASLAIHADANTSQSETPELNIDSRSGRNYDMEFLAFASTCATEGQSWAWVQFLDSLYEFAY